MKAFVTGGTGFIGSHLVDHLLRSGTYSDIRCLVRSSKKWLKDKPVTVVRGDLHSVDAIGDALSDIDVIFHLAGVVSAPTPEQFRTANVDATEGLVRLADKYGVSNMVILSSLAAAGPSNGHPKTETDPMKPVSMYGESKKEMEQIVERTAGSTMSVTVLRPPAVYGPREDQIFSLFKMMKYGLTPIVGDGNTPKLSMVYVSDVVHGIETAAQSETKGVSTYFISGQITSWNEIKQIADTVFGRSSFAVNLKPGLVKKIAGVVETTASLFGSYPVINREKAREMILEWTCSDKKAQRELGYAPQVSLEEGISRTLHWYKKHNWL
ncbi:MAG: NAD-dependent epimerase/dehydratase family protein [Bacteroidetes bacterium]|jgi:nucleoside-diphosphate-sugar epimerase|nr:NAD-dependent epimerase/dehydratase family protein [Bacteroidota bacterium]